MSAPEKRKIYFAGSIRGGRADVLIYEELVGFLAGFGEVLTSHVGNPDLDASGDEGISEDSIYLRDMAWLDEADLVIAEVTTPSLGVGYEIGAAEARGKRILCLFRQGGDVSLSAMVAGNPALCARDYRTLAEAKEYIAEFVRQESGC